MISTFGAFIDANVLYGVRLRSLIVQLAQTGLFRARWSDDVHDEWIGAILKKRRDLSQADLQPTRKLMDEAVPGALVQDYSHLISEIRLPDKEDRHVVAAAAKSGCSVIVTFNLKDFPEIELSKYGLHAKHPDEFLLDVADIDTRAFADAVKADREHYVDPPLSADDYENDLRMANCPQTADFLKGIKVLWS